MTKQKKSNTGIEQIPVGYKLEYGYVIPKEWKIVRFDKCFHRLTQKNAENNQNVLTISAQQGLISQLNYYNTLYASEDKTGYFLLQKGDFAYNKSYSTDYAYGAIKQLEKYEKGIVSPLYICFSANKNTNTDFYRQYFEAGRFNREIYKIAQEGARNHGLLNVSTPEFFSAALVCPPVAEQKKIAEILAQCDKVIELKEKCLEEEKRRKRWLVENILTGKIRLDKFSAPWEETTIGKCVEYLVGYPFASDKFTSGGIRLLRCSNVKRGCLSWEPSLTMYWREDDSLKPFLMKPGDIVVAMDGALIGRSFAVVEEADTPSYLVQRVARIRSKINDLIFQWISSDMFACHIDSRKTSTAIPHMTIKDILSFKISIPKSATEATVIGSTLQNQDKIIRLLTEEIHANKQQKKALMQLLLTGTVRVKT